MPEYQYRCTKCGTEIDRLFQIGEAPRHQNCPRCGLSAELVIGAGVHIAPSALENKGGEVRRIDATENRWQKDIPAYQRMRAHGLQPRGIDGAAVLEDKVDDQRDINFSHLYEKGISKARLTEGVEQAAELTA